MRSVLLGRRAALPTLTVFAALLLLIVTISRAEEGAPREAIEQASTTRTFTPVQTPAPAAQPIIPAQVVPAAYLPVVVDPPIYTILFGTGEDTEGNLINPGTSFPYGTVSLFYQFRFQGALNQTYRTEWTINGTLQPGLADSGTITFNDAVLSNSICFVTAGQPGCNGRPLNRGTYTARLFVNEQLVAENTAVIQ